jgi:hypothetical protein
MGNNKSSAAVKQVSESITEIAMSNIQECVVNIKQKQNLVVENTGLQLWGDYKLDQKSTINSKCFSDSALQAKLQNDLTNAIAQTTTSTGVPLLPAFGSNTSSAKTNLQNIIKNNVKMSNIQKSYNEISNSQVANFKNSGIIGFQKAQLTQGAEIFAAATLKAVEDAGIFNTIANHVDQKVASETSFLPGFLNQYIVYLFFIIFIIFVAIIIAMKNSLQFNVMNS